MVEIMHDKKEQIKKWLNRIASFEALALVWLGVALHHVCIGESATALSELLIAVLMWGVGFFKRHADKQYDMAKGTITAFVNLHSDYQKVLVNNAKLIYEKIRYEQAKTVTFWAVRDKSDEDLYLFLEEPHMENGIWNKDDITFINAGSIMYEITFENSPQKVELRLIENTSKND
jgi:hypothetical protein